MPNFMILKNITFPKSPLSRRIRCFKNFVLENYQADIDSIDLLPILSQRDRDANEICKYYQDQVIAVMNKHAPFVTLTKNQLKWYRKPWIGKRLQKLIKVKDKTYTKYLRDRSKFWYNRYRSICDIVKKSIAESKKKYFSWYFKTNMNNSEKVWKGINEIIHNKFPKLQKTSFLMTTVKSLQTKKLLLTDSIDSMPQ